MKDMQEKIRFFGRIVSVQPRANVWRYRLDNRSHGMKGYNLFLKGVADSEDKDFSIAISEKQQEKLRFECDYLEGAVPEIMQRLMETNMEHTYGYGKDAYCESAKAKIRTAC